MGADFFARAIERFLTFADAKDFPVQWFARPFAPQSFKQCATIRNHGNTAPAFPALRSCDRVTAHHNLACAKF